MTDYPRAHVPVHLFADPAAEQRWRDRFTAARIGTPEWAQDAPSRYVYTSNVSGVYEVYAWDRESDEHRQVTNRPKGTIQGAISRDGSDVWWFNDTDGDEFGHWMVAAFSGKGSSDKAFPAAHDGYPAGLVLGKTVTVVGASTDDGSTIWLQRNESLATVIYEHEQDASVSALSEDETLLAISHSEQGDSRHPDIRVINVATGETVADKTDGPGKGLDAVAFSPVLGDNRLLVTHERHGKEELLIWDVAQETERELALDLAGEVSADWYPDGQALLIAHTFQARDTLYRLDLATEELTAIDTPRGSIGSASVRPDGSIEYSWSNAAQARSIRVRTANSDDILLATPGKPAPEAYPLTDAFVQTPSGVVHALISRSEVSLPAPTIFAIHGGPHANDADYYSAYRAMWVDAGFTVVHVNYRGSTGYGSAWRDAIEGRPGLTELEDVKAVADWAVAEGIADPEKLVINGASWGGYLTLLALGLQPELWAVGVAGVPVADYVAAYEDEMEPLKAFDRALFGGTPEEKPGLYRECSPLTYVDQVTAPVIVLAGNNDPRCPIRQIHNYLDALVARDGDVETYFYDAGHGSYVIDETITQSMIELDFVRRKLG